MIRVVLFSTRFLARKWGHVIGRALDVMFGALTWAEPVRGAALVWSQLSRAARHVPSNFAITLVRLAPAQPQLPVGHSHVTPGPVRFGPKFGPKRPRESKTARERHVPPRSSNLEKRKKKKLPVESRTGRSEERGPV